MLSAVRLTKKIELLRKRKEEEEKSLYSMKKKSIVTKDGSQLLRYRPTEKTVRRGDEVTDSTARKVIIGQSLQACQNHYTKNNFECFFDSDRSGPMSNKLEKNRAIDYDSISSFHNSPSTGSTSSMGGISSRTQLSFETVQYQSSRFVKADQRRNEILSSKLETYEQHMTRIQKQKPSTVLDSSNNNETIQNNELAVDLASTNHFPLPCRHHTQAGTNKTEQESDLVGSRTILLEKRNQILEELKRNPPPPPPLPKPIPQEIGLLMKGRGPTSLRSANNVRSHPWDSPPDFRHGPRNRSSSPFIMTIPASPLREYSDVMVAYEQPIAIAARMLLAEYSDCHEQKERSNGTEIKQKTKSDDCVSI